MVILGGVEDNNQKRADLMYLMVGVVSLGACLA